MVAVAVLTVLCSLGAKAALCHQIWLNRRQRSVKGMSVPFFITGMLSYDMWVLSGVTGGDIALVLGQLPGAVLCLVIIGQALWYRSRSITP